MAPLCGETYQIPNGIGNGLAADFWLVLWEETDQINAHLVCLPMCKKLWGTPCPGVAQTILHDERASRFTGEDDLNQALAPGVAFLPAPEGR